MRELIKKIYPDKSRLPNPLTLLYAALIDFGWIAVLFLIFREHFLPAPLVVPGSTADPRGATEQVMNKFLLKLALNLILLEIAVWLAVYIKHRRKM